MAFTAKYFHEQRKRTLTQKYELNRRLWLAIAHNQLLPLNVRVLFYKKLRKTRNFSFVRLKNRCIYTNRAHSVIRYFQMSRIVFRNYARSGLLPGVRKSSW